jgi:hypothetical protein
MVQRMLWLTALIRCRLHDKGRGGLKFKSAHVAGPNVADTAVAHALRPRRRYYIRGAIRTDMQWR